MALTPGPVNYQLNSPHGMNYGPIPVGDAEHDNDHTEIHAHIEDDAVTGSDVRAIEIISAGDYTSLDPKVETTLYLISGGGGAVAYLGETLLFESDPAQ